MTGSGCSPTTAPSRAPRFGSPRGARSASGCVTTPTSTPPSTGTGLRLDNEYDGVPYETQAPIPIGGEFTYRVRFPDPGLYWYHPTSARTTGWTWACT